MNKCVNGAIIEMTAEEITEFEAMRAEIVEAPTEQEQINADLIESVNDINIDLGR